VKVVVTGGAGFIGANLCRTLTHGESDVAVEVVDDLSTGRESNLEGLDVRLTVGSVTDPTLLDRVMVGADAVVHLAALGSVPRSVADPTASYVANVTGTVEVLEACRRHGGPSVVFASSSSVYGSNPTSPRRETQVPMPASPYAANKLAAEQHALAWQRTYGLPVLAFRFFNVYGPLQAADHPYAAVIPRFVAAALADRPLEVHGDGTQTRDFTYVDTVTEVLSRAVIERRSSPEPVNLAYGDPCDLLTVIAKIEGLIGHPVERHHVDPRTGDVRHSDADSTQVRSLVPGITPVDLDAGLAATIDWFRAPIPVR
jgi:UDP-glucose 4-epimerase